MTELQERLIGKRIAGVVARKGVTGVVGVLFDDGSACTFTNCELREPEEVRRTFTPAMRTETRG